MKTFSFKAPGGQNPIIFNYDFCVKPQNKCSPTEHVSLQPRYICLYWNVQFWLNSAKNGELDLWLKLKKILTMGKGISWEFKFVQNKMGQSSKNKFKLYEICRTYIRHHCNKNPAFGILKSEIKVFYSNQIIIYWWKLKMHFNIHSGLTKLCKIWINVINNTFFKLLLLIKILFIYLKVQIYFRKTVYMHLLVNIDVLQLFCYIVNIDVLKLFCYRYKYRPSDLSFCNEFDLVQGREKTIGLTSMNDLLNDKCRGPNLGKILVYRHNLSKGPKLMCQVKVCCYWTQMNKLSR